MLLIVEHRDQDVQVRQEFTQSLRCPKRDRELEQELADLATTSPLPGEPDEARVEDWVLDAYRRHWSA